MVARWASAVVLALFAAFVCWWFATAAPPPMPAPVGPTEPAGAPAEASGAAPGDAPRTELPGAATPADAGAPAPTVPQGTLQVFVHSETGAALAGCKVTAADQTATTDATGRAELRLDAGRIHMDVRAPGPDRADAQGWQSIHAGVTTSLDVELPLRSSTSLCLQFVDAADGRPIAGAAVAVHAGHNSATMPAELRSDGDGRCEARVEVLVDWLEVRAPGRSLRIVPPQRGHETPANALVVPLDRGADLRLVVVDTAERPVAQCKLALDWHPWYLQWPAGGDSRGGPCRSEQVSDERGVATFAALPASVSLRLECAPPAGLTMALEPPFVLAAGGNERRLVLQLGGEVRGTVVDEHGAPVAGAAVGWHRPDGELPRTMQYPERMPGGGVVHADAGGAFRFACGPGEHFVGVVLQGGTQWVGPCTRVQVLSGGSQTVELTASAPLSIAGRAIDAGGEPVAGIVLDAEAGDDHAASARTGTDGRFELKGLIAGDYVLTASAYEGDLGLPRPVPVRAGDRDLEVRLEPVRGTLTGRVVDGQGAAATAWVWATQRDGDEGIGAGCDLDGTFTYRGLAAGTWDVQANDHRGRCALRTGVTVAAGRTWSLELVLQPGAVLRPRHATASSYRLESASVSLGGDGLEPGVPGECHVPPGTWTVVFLLANGEIGRRTVRVAAGDRVLVEVQ